MELDLGSPVWATTPCKPVQSGIHNIRWTFWLKAGPDLRLSALGSNLTGAAPPNRPPSPIPWPAEPWTRGPVDPCPHGAVDLLTRYVVMGTFEFRPDPTQPDRMTVTHLYPKVGILCGRSALFQEKSKGFRDGIGPVSKSGFEKWAFCVGGPHFFKKKQWIS